MTLAKLLGWIKWNCFLYRPRKATVNSFIWIHRINRMGRADMGISRNQGSSGGTGGREEETHYLLQERPGGSVSRPVTTTAAELWEWPPKAHPVHAPLTQDGKPKEKAFNWLRLGANPFAGLAPLASAVGKAIENYPPPRQLKLGRHNSAWEKLGLLGR